MNASKTEKLVRECFPDVVGEIYPCQSWHSLARAARRFVKLEQAAKFAAEWSAFRKQCRKSRKRRNDPQEAERAENEAKLPKHFGELKINNKWVKF